MAQRPNFYEKLEEVGAVGEVGQYEVSRSVGGYHPQFAAEIVSQSRREPPLEISLKSKNRKTLAVTHYVQDSDEEEISFEEDEAFTYRYRGRQPTPKWEFDEKVWVSYIHSMREFYVHLLNDVSTIESFGSSMQRCYNDKTPALPKWRLKKDLACVAQFSVDKNYYRAKIKVVGVDDCLIQFVDYGNYTWMSKGKILPLITKFGKMPPAAYKCTMKAAGDKQRTLNEFRQQVFNEEGYVICRFEQQSIVKPHPVRLFSLAMEEIVVVKVGKKMEMIGKIPLGNSQLAPVDSVIHDLGSNRLDLDDNYEVAVEIVEACEDEGFVTTVCINYGIVRGKTDSYYFYTSVRWPARPEGIVQDLRCYWKVGEPVWFERQTLNFQWIATRMIKQVSSFWLETNPTCRSLATQTDETLVSGSHLQEDRSGNHRIPVKTEIGYGLVDQLTDTGGYIRTDRFGILMFSKNSLVFDDGFINETCGSDPVVKAMLKRRADGTYKISRAGDVLFDGYLEVNQTVRYEKMVEPCNQFSSAFEILSVIPFGSVKSCIGFVTRVLRGFGYIFNRQYGSIFFPLSHCRCQPGEPSPREWINATVNVRFCRELPTKGGGWRATEVRLLKLAAKVPHVRYKVSGRTTNDE